MNFFRNRAGLALISLLAIVSVSCKGGGNGGGGGSSPLPQGLFEKYPIDGVINWAGLSTPMTDTVDILDSWGVGSFVKTSDIKWAWANDDRYLYVAVQWTDDTYNHGYDASGPLDFDGVQFRFDNNSNGTYDIGEDKRAVIAASVGSFYIDDHWNNNVDEEDDVEDGFGKLRYDSANQRYEAEFLFPLTPDTAGEDADFKNPATYSLVLFDNANIGMGTANLGSTGGLGPDSSTWAGIPYSAAGPHDYPAMPTNLSGLIVFTSEHETANNEIYSYDPATGITTKITNLPTLFKDNPSLSHDRTKIAFHGAPGPTDYANYEIYTVDIDGNNLTQLTSNAILDGHPGWSPDDQTIAYASFREGGAAHIVVMDKLGVEIADLTPSGMGYDDNDPDFLPDGRIVFKTNRFSTSPQVRIAVMDADGNNVSQLTSVSGVSDHDPVGDDTFTIFERFNKGTDYSTDLEALFTPWDIVQARLDGTGEGIVLSDGWVNWLPLYSPSGQHVLYLKSAGYTDAHLMTRSGVELGRLIPDMSKLKYIDWK